MRERTDFSVIGARAIKSAISSNLETCVRVIKEAYLAHDAGMTINPPSVFLRFPDSPGARIIALPAHLRGEAPISGLKWIASYPSNHSSDLPRASAVLILNDAYTGFPIACMEGSIISAARTAASAVLAASVIRQENRRVSSLGIVGAGLIARNVLTFLLGTGWEVPRLKIFDVNRNASERFARWTAADGRITNVEICDCAQLVSKSNELVLITTVATVPHICAQDCFSAGQTVLHLSLRDLAPEVIRSVNNIVDDPAHVLSAGTSLALAAADQGNSDFISGTLVDVMLERRELDARKATVFSPFGLGMLDVALGRWIHGQIAPDARVVVPDFFDLE